MPLVDYYEILQVSRNAEPEVIEAAFKRLSMKYHPDRSSEPDAQEKMVQINLAYHHLRDPLRRKDHDQELVREKDKAREARREAWEASKARQREENAQQADEKDKRAREEMEKAWHRPGEKTGADPVDPSQDNSKTTFKSSGEGPKTKRDLNQRVEKSSPPGGKTGKKSEGDGDRPKGPRAFPSVEIESLLDKKLSRNEVIKKVIQEGHTLDSASMFVGEVIEERRRRGISPPPLNRKKPNLSPQLSSMTNRHRRIYSLALFFTCLISALLTGFYFWKPKGVTVKVPSLELKDAPDVAGIVSPTDLSGSQGPSDSSKARAMEIFRSGKQEEAVLEVGKIIENTQDGGQAFELRAYFLGEMGRHEEAVADYTRAIELIPKKAKLFLNRAINRMKSEDFKTAVRDFSEAILLDPDDASAYFGRGICRDRLAIHDEAVADYSRYIHLRPRDAKGYFNRHFSLEKIGLKDQAEKDLQEALRLDPSLKKE
jgi:tetratricopeptide (TPR) repeat protein